MIGDRDSRVILSKNSSFEPDYDRNLEESTGSNDRRSALKQQRKTQEPAQEVETKKILSIKELIKRRELEAAVDSISEDFLSDKSF